MMTENPFPGSKIVPGPVKHDFQKMTILIFPPSHLINPQASKRATDGTQMVEGSHIVYRKLMLSIGSRKTAHWGLHAASAWVTWVWVYATIQSPE